MRKRKKRMTNSEADSQTENNLTARIKELAQGLYYTSETDAEIVLFAGKKTESATVTAEELLKQIGKTADAATEEKDFDEFFARLTQMQDWFGDEETATAEKFNRLKILLAENLKDIKVFKIGKVQIEIYVVGLDSENNLAGIQTKAVET